ncbi:MAG: hypothetical protein J7497_09520 [Chitinophagaceae bacterium]|nr:hypothetical protein [Chitinophagaceae bacterium]
MKQKNGVISTLFFFIIIFSCNLKRTENNKVIQPSKEKTGISIDSVYSLLTTGREINFKELKGSFAYIKADTAIDEHVAGFISDSIHESVLYNSFGGTKNDEIVFKDRKFLVRNRLAPLSIKLYSGSKNEKNWLVFVGQGQSASGTGVQMSFFNLLEMDHNNMYPIIMNSKVDLDQ